MTYLTASLDQMDATKRAYLELHIAVFLWGFTAILGELIQLSALSLVWWRVLITSISVVFLIQSRRKSKSSFIGNMLGHGISAAGTGGILGGISKRDILRFSFVGALTGLHWLAFYGAIKLSNASITLVCMATCAFFTAIIEPFIMKKKMNWWEIFLGFLIIPGMVLVVENVDVAMHTGIWVGLFSAFLASLFSILNKKWINNAEPFPITFIEMTSAWVFLSLIMPFYFHLEPGVSLLPSLKDFLLLLVLALGCTTLTWVLALRSLKHLSAFASNLTVNLEPVYGILLAWVMLDEHKQLSPGFYWGVALILVVVFSYPVLNKGFLKRWG